ncbi:hypothetical protein WN943_009288 [Citrus x changshan-huyou]
MGTGHQDDIGVGIDKYYSLNVPLEDGIDDESYHYNTSIPNKILVFPSKVMLNVLDTRSFNVPLLLLDGAFPLESSSSAAANGDGNSKSEVQSNTSEYIRIQHQSDTILTK